MLALAAGSVRLLESDPTAPPTRSTSRTCGQNAWDPRGNKVVRAQDATYVRRIDQALRPILNGQDLPLVLAATETIAALYRTVNSYPGLADGRNAGNPEATSDADLVAAARLVLDDIYAEQLASVRGLFDQRSSQGRLPPTCRTWPDWRRSGRLTGARGHRPNHSGVGRRGIRRCDFRSGKRRLQLRSAR